MLLDDDIFQKKEELQIKFWLKNIWTKPNEVLNYLKNDLVPNKVLMVQLLLVFIGSMGYIFNFFYYSFFEGISKLIQGGFTSGATYMIAITILTFGIWLVNRFSRLTSSPHKIFLSVVMCSLPITALNALLGIVRSVESILLTNTDSFSRSFTISSNFYNVELALILVALLMTFTYLVIAQKVIHEKNYVFGIIQTLFGILMGLLPVFMIIAYFFSDFAGGFG
ncbi:MAG: hypothetical protein N4A46_02575 [Schleiferiaceae bacterium]|jgi:hypothetical protein|nr:hypothetical protein [Schleiferiaceae bacterium]